MPEQNLVMGAVYPFDQNGNDNGLITPADQYFPKIGKIASQYFPLRNRIPLYERHHKAIATVNSLVAEHLKENEAQKGSLLDVGGSTGNRIYSIDSLVGGSLKKHLLDIDQISVEEAIGKGINAKQLNIAEGIFPYSHNSIDAASIFWVMEHLPPDTQKHVIKQIHRVLKPGGTLYLQDDKVGVDEDRIQYFETFLKPKGYDIGTFFLGIFEPTGLEPKVPEGHESIHPTSNLNPAYRLVSEPMYGSGFTLKKLAALTQEFFNLESIKLIGFQEEESAGDILAANMEEVEKFNGQWGNFIAALRKK